MSQHYKKIIYPKQGEDSEFSAILTGFGNSDAVSHASAASHHVEHGVKPMDDANRNVKIRGVGGPPPGGGSGGPPPGPGPGPRP